MRENHLLQSLRGRAELGGLPTQVNIEVTHNCNLRCRHCYLEHQDAGDELTLEEWRGVIDQVAGLGCFFIAFTGGEIFCRDDFLDIAAHAHDKGIFYHFQTNGTLIDEARADAIRQANPTKVEVSLYGATADTHDRITGVKGSFELATAAIESLRRRSIRLTVKTTVISLNWREVPALRELALGMGCGFQPDPVVMPGVFGSGKPASFRMSDDEFRSYMVMEGWHLEPDDEVSQAIRELDSPERRVICSAATSRCAISPQGDVYPCVLWHARCGNVREQTLEEIWNGAEMRRCRAMELELLRYCKDCEIIDTCVRCAALAFLEEGDELSRAPESCRMSKLLKGVKRDGQDLLGSDD